MTNNGSFLDTLIKRWRLSVHRQTAPDASMLLIGCVDARLNPNEDMGIPEGKALIYRNIAALASGHSQDPALRNLGEEAALEYAINVKGIKDIVIMGHTHCGGINACLCDKTQAGQSPALPHLNAYLNPLQSVKIDGEEPDLRARAMEKVAVLHSMNNLLSHDIVREAIAKKGLRIHGWVINTATKRIEEYDYGHNDLLQKAPNPQSLDELAKFKPVAPKHPAQAEHFHNQPGEDLIDHLRHINKARYEKIKTMPVPAHKPRALIIGGIDERVTAHSLGIKHGEAIIYRNPSAYMPGKDDPSGWQETSAKAVVEFATKAMGVKEIIVVGHRDSRGITTMLDPIAGKQNTTLTDYLKSLKNKVKGAATQQSLEETAVRESIANIKSYGIAGDDVKIEGIIYSPQTNRVEVMDGHGKFSEPVGRSVA